MERIKKWLATRAARVVVMAVLSVVVALPIVAEVLGPDVTACLAAAGRPPGLVVPPSLVQ